MVQPFSWLHLALYYNRYNGIGLHFKKWMIWWNGGSSSILLTSGIFATESKRNIAKLLTFETADAIINTTISNFTFFEIIIRKPRITISIF